MSNFHGRGVVPARVILGRRTGRFLLDRIVKGNDDRGGVVFIWREQDVLVLLELIILVFSGLEKLKYRRHHLNDRVVVLMSACVNTVAADGLPVYDLVLVLDLGLDVVDGILIKVGDCPSARDAIAMPCHPTTDASQHLPFSTSF